MEFRHAIAALLVLAGTHLCEGQTFDTTSHITGGRGLVMSSGGGAATLTTTGIGWASAAGLNNVTLTANEQDLDVAAVGRVCVTVNGWAPCGSLGASETRDAAKPGPSIQRVRLAAKPISRAQLAPAAYLKLAASIGLDSAATDEVKVLDTISTLDIKVYDYKMVDEYLYHQAVKQGTRVRWVWKPMREADKLLTDKYATTTQRSINSMGWVASGQYAQKVPDRVLARVASVIESLPEAIFLVSDYEVVKPDPFLAISTRKLIEEGKIWIIDQWDEPGFAAPGEVPEMRMGPATITSKLNLWVPVL